MRPLDRTALLALLLTGLAPAVAQAKSPSVYINNVKVDGLAGQTLTNVDVTFDANGDVRITAKGYKISSVEPATPAPPSPSAGPGSGAAAGPSNSAEHHFYIATMQPGGRTGMAQWDVDVYINQTFVKKFRSKDPEPVYNITRFLKPGPNVIHFTARKEAGERLSVSPSDFFELVVGDGEMRAGQVMLNRITTYKRTAAETGEFNSETTLNLAAAPPSN